MRTKSRRVSAAHFPRRRNASVQLRSWTKAAGKRGDASRPGACDSRRGAAHSRATPRPWRHRPARRLRRRVANKVPAAPARDFNAVLDETRPSSRTHRNLSATGDRRFFCACNPVKDNLHFHAVKSRFRELLSAPIRCSAKVRLAHAGRRTRQRDVAYCEFTYYARSGSNGGGCLAPPPRPSDTPAARRRDGIEWSGGAAEHFDCGAVKASQSFASARFVVRVKL